MPVNTTIIVRKGTVSEWVATNPVLASGEPGYDTTNNILKIGDGLTAWNSLVGHKHSSSDIPDFNSSVSGLLPVKNIVGGSGIDVSSSSGIFTIAVTGVASLIGETVDDRVAQLLVAGTGVYLDYNDPSGTLTLHNLHTEINVLAQEPQGFVNRTDSVISFNDSTRTFTIDRKSVV